MALGRGGWCPGSQPVGPSPWPQGPGLPCTLGRWRQVPLGRGGAPLRAGAVGGGPPQQGRSGVGCWELLFGAGDLRESGQGGCKRGRPGGCARAQRGRWEPWKAGAWAAWADTRRPSPALREPCWPSLLLDLRLSRCQGPAVSADAGWTLGGHWVDTEAHRGPQLGPLGLSPGAEVLLRVRSGGTTAPPRPPCPRVCTVLTTRLRAPRAPCPGRAACQASSSPRQAGIPLPRSCPPWAPPHPQIGPLWGPPPWEPALLPTTLQQCLWRDSR